MDLWRRGCFPPRPTRTVVSRLRMVKVFAPMLLKLLFSDDFMTSIDVKIPTKAAIPNAIIKMVKIALSSCPLIEDKATRIFSRVRSSGLLVGEFIVQRYWLDLRCKGRFNVLGIIGTGHFCNFTLKFRFRYISSHLSCVNLHSTMCNHTHIISSQNGFRS